MSEVSYLDNPSLQSNISPEDTGYVITEISPESIVKSNMFDPISVKSKQKRLEEQDLLKRSKMIEILLDGISGKDTSKEFEELDEINEKIGKIESCNDFPRRMTDFLFPEYPMTSLESGLEYLC